jgi:Histidine phosphatase superfamily (branch 1)
MFAYARMNMSAFVRIPFGFVKPHRGVKSRSMTPEFIFTRHGESTANISRTISNRLPDSAPLTRAEETAEIIAAAFGLEVELVDGLREPDCGMIEGRNDAEAWRMHAAQELTWGAGSHDYRILGGESFNDVQQRFIPSVSRIISKYGNHAGAVIAGAYSSSPLASFWIVSNRACSHCSLEMIGGWGVPWWQMPSSFRRRSSAWKHRSRSSRRNGGPVPSPVDEAWQQVYVAIWACYIEH